MTGPSYGSLDAWDWEHLPVSTNLVLRRWWSMLGQSAPWCDMHPDDRFGEMRHIVHDLINEARDPDDGTRPQRLAMSAQAHGKYRQNQNCTVHHVLREVCLLRSAIASLLLDGGWSHQSVTESLIVLDLDFATVRHGVLRSASNDDTRAEGVL